VHLLVKHRLLPSGLPTDLDLPEAVEYSELVALEALGSVQVVLHQLVLLVAPFHRLLEALVERPQE
jgi:hypothetical protein